jgi:hypothetical protein
MTDEKMMAQIAEKRGFIAALDQSGGSTPGALRQYGVPDNAYSGDAEMFKLMHEMRVRIMTSPAFRGDTLRQYCSKPQWTDRRTANPCRPSCGKTGGLSLFLK